MNTHEVLKLALEAWKNAAIRLGEELSSVGPDGYYDMTAQQWLDWAMEQEPRGKNSLAQPEQEPVAWEQFYPDIGKPQLKQEPVGFMNAGHVHEMQQGRLPYGYVYPKGGVGADIAVYTTPPKEQRSCDKRPWGKPWVSLTDEEIWKFWWSRPEVLDGEDDGMEAEFVAAVRRVLAAQNIGVKP